MNPVESDRANAAWSFKMGMTGTEQLTTLALELLAENRKIRRELAEGGLVPKTPRTVIQDPLWPAPDPNVDMQLVHAWEAHGKECYEKLQKSSETDLGREKQASQEENLQEQSKKGPGHEKRAKRSKELKAERDETINGLHEQA